MNTLSLSWTAAGTYIRKVVCITCHSGGAELPNPQHVFYCLLLPPFTFIRFLHFHIANIQISFFYGCPLNNYPRGAYNLSGGHCHYTSVAHPIFDAVSEF
jgi:hypothetical protein